MNPNAPQAGELQLPRAQKIPWLWAILGVFLALGVVYDLTTPILEKPDEALHFFVVKAIKENGRLPVLSQEAGLYRQQALQAPLYYLLAAAAVAPVDLSDAEARLWPNPKANYGDATLPGKNNVWIHTAAEAFPWRGATLGVHIARWVSLLLGLGTVVCTYHLARLACSGDEPLALAAAALVAFLPQFLFIHTSVSNDSAVTLFSTLTLTLLVWIAERGLTARRTFMLGIALGLGALSKLTGTMLMAVALAGLGWIAWRRREWSRLPVSLVVASGTALVISGWWYVRNLWLYGDPLALTPFLNTVGRMPDFDLPMFLGATRLVVYSTWGLFGQISILVSPAVYALLNSLVVLSGLGWMLKWFGVGRNPNAPALRSPEVLGGWAAAAMALVVRWMLESGAHGRLVFPGIAALAVLIVAGWRELAVRARLKLPLRFEAVPVGIVGLVAVISPFAYILPAYAPPRQVESLAAGTREVSVEFGQDIRLEGYAVEQSAGRIRLTFYWRALRLVPSDYQAVVRLRFPDGSLWLDYVNYFGQGTSLSSTWRPGELREDRYEFRLDRLPSVDDDLTLLIGLFDPASGSVVTPTLGEYPLIEGYLVVLEGGIRPTP